MVDPDKIAFFAENKCSDEVLQFAIDKYNEDYEKDLAMLGLGLAFTFGSMLIMITLGSCFICKSKCESCLNKCCKKEEA